MIFMILTGIGRAWRFVADHATKALGAAGAAVMAGSEWIDPDAVMGAAGRFLQDAHLIKRIGLALFVLVFLRGIYTARKYKQLKAAAQPPGTPQ